MGQLMGVVQEKWRNTSYSFSLGAFRLFSGMVLGLTFALIGDEALGYGNLAFLFVLVSVTVAFMRISKHWRVVGVFIFDLICVLGGMFLKLYILVAPGN